MSAWPNRVIAEGGHVEEGSMEQHVYSDYDDHVDDDGEDVPNIYGTSPETTFKFIYNGRVLEPGESMLICTAAPGQTCSDTTEE